MATPRLKLSGEPIQYDGKQVGYYATNLETGKIVVAMWKPLFRIHNSYALSVGLYEQIDDDVTWFFVVDQDTGDVYRFHRDTYYDAPIKYGNSQRQLAPPRDEHDGMWPDSEDDIVQ